MNAAMLHERIAAGNWLPGIAGLDEIKNATDPLGDVLAQWNRITRHDFLPVLEPAVEILEAVRKHGRLDGANRALRHLAGEAEQIAAHYADLGADYAGELFNKVMGNQSSDGAFFTRTPAAASWRNWPSMPQGMRTGRRTRLGTNTGSSIWPAARAPS